MLVYVETCGDEGTQVPCGLQFDARAVDIAEVIDRWFGAGYCYFKVKTGAGDVYFLRFDEGCAEWSLTMFQSARPSVIPREFRANKHPADAPTMLAASRYGNRIFGEPHGKACSRKDPCFCDPR